MIGILRVYGQQISGLATMGILLQLLQIGVVCNAAAFRLQEPTTRDIAVEILQLLAKGLVGKPFGHAFTSKGFCICHYNSSMPRAVKFYRPSNEALNQMQQSRGIS